MRSMKKSIMIRSMVMVHFVVMAAIFFGVWMQFYRAPAAQGEYFVHNRTIIAAYIMILFALSRVYPCYHIGLLRVRELVYNQTMANLISWGITYVLLCIMAQRLVDPLAGIGCLVAQSIFSVLWTIGANKLYFKLHEAKRTVIIYQHESDLRKLEEIRFFEDKWRIERRVRCEEHRNPHDLPDTTIDADEGDLSADVTVEGNIHKIIKVIQDYDVVFVSGISATLRNGIIKYCVEANKSCFFVPHTGDVIVSGAKHIRSFAVPICRADRCKPKPETVVIKRLTDIVISGAALILFSPLMLLTALAIKLYDKGPALYKQVRLTKDGREFKILKFRSMRTDAEKDGIARLSTGDKDDRVTPIGKVIRAIRFDELPQLINILRGDMSIVGPRPERPEIAAQYEKELPAFKLRLQVQAGLTGYAQVYGQYNTEPADKLKMDLMYINNFSLIEDLKIMFATVGILFKKESTEGVKAGQAIALGQKRIQQEDSKTA